MLTIIPTLKSKHHARNKNKNITGNGLKKTIGLFQVTSPKRKKKGTFISGTVDIDDLLAKEQTPTNFALDDNSLSSPPPESSSVATTSKQQPTLNGGQGPYKKHVDFSEPVNLTTNEDDKPWWTASNGDETLFSGNYPLQKHDIAELILHSTSTRLFKKLVSYSSSKLVS